MAQLSRAVAALRISGSLLVPREVSALLGRGPTQGWVKGETLTAHGVTRIARFGLWSREADDTEPADLDGQVATIVGSRTPDLSVWASLRAAFDLDLFCGWFMKDGNEGTSIEPGTMTALGERGISLDVDLYS